MSAARLLAAVVFCPGRARGAEYHWVVRQDVASPDGYPRGILAVMDARYMAVARGGRDHFNDKVVYAPDDLLPGPELRVKRGERLVVHVENRLPSTSISIHWHGVHMKNQAWMDGTAGVTGCPIPGDGGVGTYNFTVDQGPGTHWWHSHVGTQYADGIFGAFVIEPAEGEIDPVQAVTPYTGDQVLMIQDWLHETYYDITTRYRSRIGAFTQTYHDPITGGNHTLPFLPDYPWPTTHVLLNGRGQTNCKWRLWKDCDEVRLEGWAHYFNESARPQGQVHLADNGLPTGTYGQCMPERPPLMGRCEQDAEPAVVRCQAGGATRLRLVNAGFSMPLRFWVSGHMFLVVARDGVPVVPTGPHSAVVVPVGGRLDVVVNCSASPHYRYKVFAMVALREFYPGAQSTNEEASSYALLSYGDGPPPAPIAEPDVAPSSFYTACSCTVKAKCSCNCNYREFLYSSWNVSCGDYLPTAIDASMRPLPVAGYPAVVAPPAQERVVVSVSGRGNWWNNMSNAESLFGLRFEWWNMNRGPNWTDSTMPLFTPDEPVMLSRLFGRNITETYGTSDPRDLPFVQVLRFNRTAPVTYEVVVINHEGQQHPFHLHGHTLQKVAHGWLDPVSKWRSKNRTSSAFLSPEQMVGPARFDEPVAAMVHLDTWTLAPFSYAIFRLTADNPGAWMMHCHMDYHLGAGQGMLWSTEEDGRYPLPPPPGDWQVCGRASAYGALGEFGQAPAAQATALGSEDAEELARLREWAEAAGPVLAASVAAAFAAGAFGGALAAACAARRREAPAKAPSSTWSSDPRVVGSPTGSYHSVSD